MTTTSSKIERAAEILRGGGVVAFPTETVYGLGADALNARAVARVFDIKGRPRFDPLIVHVNHPDDLQSLVSEFSPIARALAERFWPGPLTLVLPRKDAVPDIVTAGLLTVAVRIPRHPVARELIRIAACPIAAPSANLFGRISPTCAQHVRDQLGGRVDAILDGGPCEVGVESTILLLADPANPYLLRPGGVPLEDLEAVLGPIRIFASSGSEAHTSEPLAPGMLPQHYAPRTPLILRHAGEASPRTKSAPASRIGLLSFQSAADQAEFSAVEVLSATGDLREAATRLFAALRRLDALGLDLIVAEHVPNQGLGMAINDRLTRASVSPLTSRKQPT